MMKRKLFSSLTVLAVIIGVHSCSYVDQSTIIIADFDGNDFGDWVVEGSAFSSGPAGGEDEHHMLAILGTGFAASLEEGSSTGSLTSPSFMIERNSIHFLLSSHEIFYRYATPDQQKLMSIQLLINEEVVRETVPDEFHAMFWRSWDVTQFMGSMARIRIVDDDPREWTHIDVDQIIQNDIPVSGFLTSRSMSVTNSVLNIPVQEGAERFTLGVFIDGVQVREMDVELAPADHDYYVFTDLSPWLGKEIEIRTTQFSSVNLNLLKGLLIKDELLEADDLYTEPLRQQFHFSSKRGWINDPNGLVYYDGEYHLFYQHNPFGWDHSRNDYNKTWGHAISTDLVRWVEYPGSIHPDHLGPIYSGSSVVDNMNTTGFQTGDEKPIVSVYTSAGGRSPWSKGKKFTQSIAYSNDRGRTFTIYEGNPVQPNLDYINRDPRAIWHEPSGQWVIVLHFDERAMAFFTSKDLKTWEYQSELEIEYLIDCPELFELPVDGNADDQKWVLYGGPGAYIVGDFDGKQFTPETEETRYHYGNAFYASQTFSNIPEADGRRIQMAWAPIQTEGMSFNMSMLFPVELTLHSTIDGLRLFAYPVREIENLYTKYHTWTDLGLAPGNKPLNTINAELLDIEAEFEIGESSRFGLIIKGLKIVYDVKARRLICGEESAALTPVNNRIRLRILVDRISVEIFANDGAIYMPMNAAEGYNERSVELFSKGGSTLIKHISVNELSNIW